MVLSKECTEKLAKLLTEGEVKMKMLNTGDRVKIIGSRENNHKYVSFIGTVEEVHDCSSVIRLDDGLCYLTENHYLMKVADESEMPKLITTFGEFGHFENDLTKELDTYLTEQNKLWTNYIYSTPMGDTFLIRYPGATRGYIKVDGNMVIKEVVLYESTNDIYKPEVDKCLNKYLGMKIVIK